MMLNTFLFYDIFYVCNIMEYYLWKENFEIHVKIVNVDNDVKIVNVID